jgi:phage terminase large subunit GpA-like protein
MGKTELIFNLLGHTLTDRPKPCMYVGPTEDAVRTQAKDRFLDMVETTPELANAADPRDFRNSTVEKWYNGARVGFAWAGSGSQLRAHPAALALGDEIDAFAPIPGEGDPVQLMRARVSNYFGSTVGLFSTPLLEETSRIWRWFMQGTKERWSWQCSSCSLWFTPTLDLLRWKKDSEGKELQASARVHCSHCDQPHDDDERRQLEGRYIPHAMGEDGVWLPLEDRADLTVRSFWVSGLASPFRTIGRAAEEVARAFRSGDPDEVQAATNTVGGEPYGLQGDTPGKAAVKEKKAVYEQPAGVRFVTIGCDVQQESIYYVVRGWGHNAESWLLGHGQVWGNTEFDDAWIALGAIISRPVCGMVPRLTLIDSGYRAAQVYAFARRTPNVSPTKGHDTQVKPHYDSLVDESPRGKVVKAGVRLWHINTDYYKQWVYGRIRWPHGQPGDWHIPESIDDDYCEQVVNEIRTVVKGKVVWLTTGKRQNHYLDCEVNASCAAQILNVMAVPKHIPADPKKQSETPVSQSRPAASPFARRGL